MGARGLFGWKYTYTYREEPTRTDMMAMAIALKINLCPDFGFLGLRLCRCDSEREEAMGFGFDRPTSSFWNGESKCSPRSRRRGGPYHIFTTGERTCRVCTIQVDREHFYVDTAVGLKIVQRRCSTGYSAATAHRRGRPGNDGKVIATREHLHM